jgi:general stress protein 26
VNKLNDPMKWIIQNFNAGSVATITDNGHPAVSPKATFVIVNDSTIAFGDIRSPGTIHNLKQRPETEVNFIDVLHRKAVRIRGTADVVSKGSQRWKELVPVFEESWQPYLHLMSHFVSIEITNASLVTSPAYDIGLGEEELRKVNLEKLNNLDH